MTKSDMRKYLAAIGSKGGKTTGKSKARDPEHYKRLADMKRAKPKPVCTNIHKTCTYEDCPLKALYEKLGATAYLGNCMGYVHSSLQNAPDIKKGDA